MDGNGVHSDLETQIVSDRLAETRERIGDTVEALVYKADVPARTSEAVADGIAAAKDKLSIAADVASNQAVGVAATIYETVESASGFAAIATSSVPRSTGKAIARVAIGIAIVAAIGLLIRKRRRSHTEIDESPEVQKARQLTD